MENASVEHIPAPLPPRPRSSFPVPPMPLGVISRHSPFYVRREADQRLSHELANSRQHGGLLRLKGPRQSGKTSLVARTLEEARDAGFQVIMADLRQLNQSDFEGLESFYAAFTRLISMSMNPEDAHYDSGLGSPNQRLTEFMEMHVFARLGGPVLLALDNIERMIRQSYSPEVFGLMRSWFEFRETRQQPWRRFTLLISYADDELSLEERMNHSPFNVGIRIEVGGLTLSGVEQLNQAYDGPLANQDECGQFLRLTGGKPFLVNFGLYDLARRKLSFTDFNVIAAEDDGPYRDELRRVRRLVDNSAPLRDGVGAVLRGKTCPSEQVFFDLQSLGILSGVQRQPRFSCDLYARYFGGRSGQSTTGS